MGSSRHRDRSRDRDRDRRDRDRDRDRRERRRSRDRDRHRDRDRDRERRDKDRRSRSRSKGRERSKEKSPEPDAEKLLAETLATIAATRNFASLVTQKEAENEANRNGEKNLAVTFYAYHMYGGTSILSNMRNTLLFIKKLFQM